MNIKIAPWISLRRVTLHTRLELNKVQTKSIINWNKFHLNRYESEIFNSCIILKNLAIVQKEMPFSTDYVLEELKNNSKYLKNVYGKIISDLRKGLGDEAFDVLEEMVPTRAGRSFTHILKKLDKINPAELVSAMVSFEESFSSERITKALRNTEKKSMITTAFSTASIFAILMNFSVVVVFMDTLSMLGQIF